MCGTVSWNAKEVTLSGCFLILACGWIVPAQGQTIAQGASGLSVTSVKVKQKRLSADRRLSRPYSPKITPALGRGTRDRTDSPEVASLKEIRDDRVQRQRDLRALDSQSRNSARSRHSVVRYGYEVRARITNDGLKPITKLLWAYRPSRNSQIVLEKKFFCHLSIQPGQSRNLKVVFPVRVLNATFTDPERSSLSDVVIEHVEYSDGTGWQLPTVLQPHTAGTLPQVKKGKCTAF